ncbi:hypothetical protein ASPZODRAFT_168198 [Penicilliopsis zonata CBS 506.65]|uniref:Carboxylic ester hydrolase n=1 Tax=Penicilliopsis zonata CBS 506.65 TaxID=1073090 RepID=A0A1L9SDD1_9EURO|nr:hypothetical protein ASPZODRAFT_168198 [Penicilliopsis zonata CBS 506.65]OJJ45123.1 hypothetical protein ASPZODRAFT_168198 [Penicilliopsis zonata CBS 506.65]
MIVTIDSGKVAGTSANVTVFKGIPFAASTAGTNRWKPPQPVKPWTGIRDCSSFGPIPPQLPPGPLFWTKEPVAQSEDCLNLNIWTVFTPRLKPVYVWIYGGKFLWGAGCDNNFDGSRLAAQGVVVVTFNYRLGILGWLAHPDLSAEDIHHASGNYGLQDQIACLQWVQRNIAAFGGDPNRVTIGGQSAGSACVGLHVYGPQSRGLFHGAIFQSGCRHPRDPLISCLAPSYRTKDQAEREGQMIVREKGAASIHEMREMELDKLLEGNHRDDETLWGPPPFYRAVLDGWLFPRRFEDTLLYGLMNDVPLLNGQNKDEGGNYTHPDFNMDDLEAVVPLKYGKHFTPRWFSLYHQPGQSPLSSWNTACQDNSRVGPHLHHELWRRHATSPIYIYHFTHAPPPRRGFPTDFPVEKKSGYVYFNGSRTGAYHAAEIPYVFDSLWTDVDQPWNETDRRVARYVSAYWVNFIATGDPNGEGLPFWPSAEQDGEHVMQLGREPQLIKKAEGGREQFWRDYLAAQGGW